MATLPGLSLGLGLEDAAFNSGMRRAQAQMESFGRQAQVAGAAAQRGFGLAGGAIRGMATDLGVAVRQIGAGADVVTALSIQVAQSAARFGAWGAAAGAGVAILGSLYSGMRETADATKEAEAATRRFGEVQAALKAFLDSSTGAINDQAAAVSRLAGAQRELGTEGLHLQLAQANARISAESDALRTTLGELQSTLLQPSANEIQGRGPILAALTAISEAMARGDPSRLAASISGLVRQMDDPALLEFQEKIVTSGANIQNLKRDSDQLRKSLEQLNKGGIIQTAAEMTKSAAAAAKFAAETEKLTGAQKRLAEAGRILTRTSAQEQRFDQQAEKTTELLKGMQDFAREQDRVARDMDRGQERMADVALQPLRTALGSAQTEVAGFFESMLDGSVRTFSDMAQAFKSIFIRGIANAASVALFNPTALASMFASSPAAAGAPGAATGVLGTTTNWSQLATAGALGAAGGGLFGGLMGGHGALGGSLGGAAGAAGGAIFAGSALGTAMFPGIGTVGGALIGGLLGGAGGGLLGSLFGGKDKGAKFSGSGGLGGIAAGGEIGRFLQDIDQSLIGILNSRQQQIVDQALRASSVSVRAKDFDQNVQAFAASQRIGPAASALGFNASAVTGGGSASAQAQVQNLQTALGVQDAIRRLVEPAFQVASSDLVNEFEEITAQARRFGVSLNGMIEAQDRAVRDLAKSQDAQLAALLDPFKALSAPLDAFAKELAFAGLNPAEQFAKAQADFQAIAAAAQGGDLEAIANFTSTAGRFVDLAGQVGASPGQARAISQVESALGDIKGEITASQAEAGLGIMDAVDRHRRQEIDTLRELIEEVRIVARKLDKPRI